MPRVLIVDDNPSLLKISSIAMRREGYEVEVALGAEDCLERLAESDFDLVLVDQKMPGMNGVELVQEVQKRRFSSMLALMTGIEHPDVVNSGFPYLMKPFDYNRLVQFVHSLFDART